MKRREFLSFQTKTALSPQKDTKILSGLTPYTGTWGIAQVRHLLKRTIFGATKSDIDYFLGKTMTQAVDELLTPIAAPNPPINNYGNGAQTQDPNVPLGQTWVNDTINFSNPLISVARQLSLKNWWLGEMLKGNRNITEKMTLFWHNHFAAETDVVKSAELMYDYNALLRQYALGNFKTFTKQITLNPAMLMYLNGQSNSAGAPDENYARELQELFTVGHGTSSLYTEDDVKAAAKILTGYRVNPLSAPYTYYFDASKHDTTNKQFSSFYNNTVITGKSGQAGQTELDELLNMIFSVDEVAKHICRRLYMFFVYYEINTDVETNIITPLATLFRNANYEILPVLDALFKSEHFYDIITSVGAMIKNPLDTLVGLCREFAIAFPTATNFENQYRAWDYIRNTASNIGMHVLEPPLVAGWYAYYQAPQFHEQWINSDTLPKRLSFIHKMLDGYNQPAFSLKIDPVAFALQMNDPGDPDVLVADSVDYLYCMDVSTSTKDYFKGILLSGQASNSYWTTAWDNYINTPANDPNYAMYYNIVYTRLQALYRDMLSQAEYQLS